HLLRSSAHGRLHSNERAYLGCREHALVSPRVETTMSGGLVDRDISSLLPAFRGQTHRNTTRLRASKWYREPAAAAERETERESHLLSSISTPADRSTVTSHITLDSKRFND
ncbi:unnamed protein product, partial [Ectocarpus fasciculatus]